EAGGLLRYRGLDHVERRTQIQPVRRPDRIADGSWVFLITLEQHECAEIEVAIACELQEESLPRPRFDETAARARSRHALGESADVVGSNPVFNQWVRRSFADLAMLTTD